MKKLMLILLIIIPIIMLWGQNCEYMKYDSQLGKKVKL